MNSQLLGRSGLRVSELCMGTMTFGEEWGQGANKATSKKLYDMYREAGGYFFDTANRYTEGTSERWLGEFMKSERDSLVVATKYSLMTHPGDLNNAGNHRKNLYRSVFGSLERLGTDYIDLFWLHAWDYTTPIEEVLRALDDLVSQGVIHYIGISDTPAWIVSRAAAIADLRGWAPLVALQVEYSLVQRTVEPELIAMARALDLAVTPWSPLGAGVLTGKYLGAETAADSARQLPADNWKRTPRMQAIAREVVNVAQEIGASPAQVALAWLRQQAPVTLPIIGARTPEQLADNLGCLSVELSGEHMNRLDEVSALPDLPFPHRFLNTEPVRRMLLGEQQDRFKTHRMGF